MLASELGLNDRMDIFEVAGTLLRAT